MASGGLPPQHIMPPPRGRTPGATSDVAQNLNDEEIAKKWWEVSERNRQEVENRTLVKLMFDINSFQKFNMKKLEFFSRIS